MRESRAFLHYLKGLFLEENGVLNVGVDQLAESGGLVDDKVEHVVVGQILTVVRFQCPSYLLDPEQCLTQI